jgi:RNA polymerase sigma-70 factor (ECF subfamily)
VTHRSQLVRFFTQRTGSAAEADDVVQEIWLRLERAGGPVGNTLAYLHRIGMNIVVDRLRERQRRGRRDAEWSEVTADEWGKETIDGAPSAFDAADSKQRLRQVAEAISRLPPGAGRVFRRLRIDGLTHAEVAQEMGISKSAVEKHIAVALRHLKKALEQ